MFNRKLIRNYKLIFSFLFIFFTSIIAQTGPMIFQPIFKQDETIRSTKGREILKYMNLTANPCTDFYTYACGNWGKYNYHLKEHEILTNVRYLEHKIDGQLQSLLEQQVTIEDGLHGRKVKEFYSSCKTALSGGQRQQAFHNDFIKSNGGFPAVPGSNWATHYPHYDWVQVIAELRQHYGMDILIGIDVDINPLNMYENSVFLTEPSTIIPKELCSAEGTRKIDMHREKYEWIEKEIAAYLKLWLSMTSEAAEKVAKDILIFEYELCTNMHANYLPGDSNYENILSKSYPRRTVYEFTHHFNDSIDFNKFLSGSFGMPFTRPVFMRSEQYIWHLIKTIEIHEKSTIANYIMYRALSELTFPLNDNSRNRQRFCTQIAKRYFPQILGSMYYYKYANTEMKKKIKGIFEKLKIAFDNSLQYNWLEGGTSRVGRAKLNDITLYFPDYQQKPNLNNLAIDINNYWHNLEIIMQQSQKEQLNHVHATENLKPTDPVEAYEVRMKYREEFKRIDVGWALIQPPFYQESYPNSMLYAMIGQKIGSELAAAFNDIGWTSDLLNQSNWDYETATKYKEQSECFRIQISNYLNNKSNYYQNTTQLRDFIAISSGLNVAFNAYLHWLDYLNPNNDFTILSKETLPDLNFSNTQLFFITYAQMNCQLKESNKTIIEYLPLLGHSLERYLVNGPLWNNVDFSKEFDCKLGSEMNPADKCVIY